MRLLAVFAALILVVHASDAQQVYRWVDKDGGVHYTQTPPPRDAAKSLQQKSYGSSTGSIELPYATRVAMKAFPITLYTAPDCGKACTDGRGYLQQRGVPFREVVVADEKAGAELQRIAGKTYVPVLVVGTEVQNGYEETAWKEALDVAGYPASGPRIPPQAAARKPAASGASAEKRPVRLYTSPNCGLPCNNARKLLTVRAVPFEEITVDTPEKADDLNRISGESTVPTLVVGTNVQKGFEAYRYNSAVDAGGYESPPAAKQ
jgi:glutaredoxin